MNITLFIEYSNSFRTSRSFLELREAHTHSSIKYFTISTVLAAVVALYKAKYEELRCVSLTITLISIMAITLSLFRFWSL